MVYGVHCFRERRLNREDHYDSRGIQFQWKGAARQFQRWGGVEVGVVMQQARPKEAIHSLFSRPVSHVAVSMKEGEGEGVEGDVVNEGEAKGMEEGAKPWRGRLWRHPRGG